MISELIKTGVITIVQIFLRRWGITVRVHCSFVYKSISYTRDFVLVQ